MTPTTLEVLDRLVAFPTVSRTPNTDLMDYVASLLRDAGIEPQLVESTDGRNVNLYATVGPTDRPGVMLSGHTDVVPVEGQAWTVPPFELTRREGRCYGRGTADMKGFVAAAVRAALDAAGRDLATPLHLALSYDEEVGCVGVRDLLTVLAEAPFVPRFGIVGEPTSLQIATGHKGKMALRAEVTGREAHSALAPQGFSALHLACDFVAELRTLQRELADTGATDDAYEVPYTTVHVGTLNSGTALNIVPNRASAAFEIRSVGGDDPEALLARVHAIAASLVDQAREQCPEADIVIVQDNVYPGLDIARDDAVVQFVRELTGANTTTKVAFGTEAGLFAERLSVPTVICGPGSMNQGHKADEFVTDDQLARCDAVLATLLTRLEAGLD